MAVESCVSSFFAVNYSYFFSPENLETTKENINCVDKNLSAAEALLGNSQGRSLSLEAFQAWLNEEYYAGNPISSQHLASWLLFKKWVVGGDANEISNVEVKGIRELLGKWKTFVVKINQNLKKIVSVEQKASLSQLRLSQDEIRLNLKEFLQTFPNLISKFSFQSFVALIYQNRAYHKDSQEEISPALLKSLLWFANGQESTVLSGNTGRFLLLCHYHYFKFRAQVGVTMSSSFYNTDEFAEFGIDLSKDLRGWLEKVSVFDYKGIQYLSEYLSGKVFSSKYSSQKIYKVLKLINDDYLTDGDAEHLSGFTDIQNNSLENFFLKIKKNNGSIDKEYLESDNSNWTFRFLKKVASRGYSLVFDQDKKFDLINESSGFDEDAVKSMHLASAIIEKILSSKGSHYVTSLTEEEFNAVLSDFEIFESLWSAEGRGSQFFYANEIGRYSTKKVTQQKLFYFFTQKIQSDSFKKIVEESF